MNNSYFWRMSPLRRLIWLKFGAGGGGSSSILKTVTGSLLHITDALAKPAKKFTATLSPVQDLHGQANPYPAGGGKNKLPYATSNSFSQAGITIIKNSDGSLSCSGTSTAATSITLAEFSLSAGSYVFNGGNQISLADGITLYIRDSDNATTLASISMTTIGTDRSFSIGSNTNIRFYIVFGSSNLTISGTFFPMIRLATETDSTYAPYSNLCPITGHTGVSVVRTGKNVLEPKFYHGGTYNADVGRQFTFTENTTVVKTGNVYSASVEGWGAVTLVSKLLKAGTYKVNIQVSAPSVRTTIYTLDKDYRVIWKANATSAQTWTNTITMTADGYIAVYLASSTAGEITFTEPQIEIGDTFTGYEEYKGQTIPITFPDAAGTVYGGTLTFEDGVWKLRATDAEVDLGALSWTKINTTSPHWRFWAYLNDHKLSGRLISSKYKYITPTEQYTGAEGISAQASGSSVLVMVSDEQFTDAASFEDAMSGVQCVYELAEPIEYTLTETQALTLLKGENVVWCDSSDDLELQYYAKAEETP